MSRAAVAALVIVACGGAAGPARAHTPLAWLDDTVEPNEVRHLFWPQIAAGQPIPFRIGDAGTPDVDIPDTDPAIDEFEALTLAFAAWQQVPGVPLQFDLAPTTTNGFGLDGENVIFFADLGAVGYGGVTFVTYDNTTGEILDVDIHMNDHDIRWRTSLNDPDGEPLGCPCQGVDPAATFTNDVQGLATHEIGHALGLDHSAVGLRESAATPTMYPRGIWNVPGDGDRPPNSRYRTIEPDDEVGIRALYPPPGPSATTATLHGVVHDRHDRALFGAHVVARDLAGGAEIGAMSGTLRGPFSPETFELAGLPPATYEVRVEPLDFSPPGLVGKSSFGGIAKALVPQQFPAEIELDPIYEKLVQDPLDAAPVALAAGDVRQVTFRPVGTVRDVPALIRPPRAFDLTGVINADVTGPLADAALVYTVDGATEVATSLGASGGPYGVSIPLLPSGTRIDYHVEAATTAGAIYTTPPRHLQIGLTGEPLIFVSMNGSHSVAVVDSGTLFQVDESFDGFSFPLGQALHHGRNGLYVASFGVDHIDFVPLFAETLPPTHPLAFDLDGDGLHDGLEPAFGTSPLDPDTDGDLTLDGTELSELAFLHPEAGESFFDVVGGVLAADGTPIGGAAVSVALWNVTEGAWNSSAMSLTPTGRFRWRLPSSATFRVSFYDSVPQFVGGSANWSGAPGEIVDGGIHTLPVAAPDPPLPDTGTDPLDSLDGAPAVLLPTAASIDLEPGANAYAVGLADLDPSFLYATGSGTGKVYKIDTATDTVVGEAAVGAFPRGLAVMPDRSKLYVANAGEAIVSVLDADTLATLAAIPVPGPPQYVSLTPDGSTAVVITGGSQDVVLVDTATDGVIQSLPSGLGGLSFLSQVGPCDERALAGKFTVGTSEVAWIATRTRRIDRIALPAVDTTSGLALHPDGVRGYAVHYLDPQLLEIDLPSATIARRLDFGFVDIRDIWIFPEAGWSADQDRDARIDACDNCASLYNPAQGDLDLDGEGDACDLDDGLIHVALEAGDRLVWQLEAGHDAWNVYRGDLDVLRQSGVYTQEPGTNPAAARFCGLVGPELTDPGAPAAGSAFLYLVTGVSGSTEADPGSDSEGRVRPNDHPCP